LTNLQSQDGETVSGGRNIGTIWVARGSETFNNIGLVVLISSYPGGRGVNYFKYIAVSTKSGSFDIPVAPAAGGVGVTLDIADLSSDVSGDTSRVVAHELGHSFGLGDEYAEFEESFRSPSCPYSNVQLTSDVSDAGGIEDSLIMWNWPRIDTAAVLRAVPTDAGVGTFEIPVTGPAGIGGPEALQFANGDIVHLRLRIPGTALRRLTGIDVSQPLQVVGQPSASAVTVKPVGSVTLAELQAFAAGSLLYRPVNAPAAVRTAAYPYALMVAKNIADLIKQNHQPLYSQPTNLNLSDFGIAQAEDQKPKLDGVTPGLPGQPFCFKSKTRIVGLYEGGATYAKGTYHPTGHCMMRNSHEDSAEFCPVCRYIMVDLIDPRFHAEIDRDYDKIYPLK
jgi:hypothetical protein